MIRADDSDPSIVQCLTQCISIPLCLDCGITFDASSQSCIVPIAEVEMRYSGFSGDVCGTIKQF